ncbi:radical SAM/SPASM domain-containing protein [Nitratidesulfovibrio sp.]|uniref:radical SAM/SPASM domain-containing protein n=1 Tax=Nitratidesulfovibrio sp. TaxID=2802297 RepID=UPI00333FAB62
MPTAALAAPLLEAAPQQDAQLPYPRKLFVEVTSRCNLHCRMCVKHSGTTRAPEGDMTAEIYAALLPAMPHLNALVLNGVGEPLLHRNLETFIRLARQHMPPQGWVGFQTNGHLLTESRAHALQDAGLDRICLSIDAVSPELFSTCRAGGDMDHMERALASLAAARAARPAAPLAVGVEFVVMRDNLHELPATLRWAAERGADFAIVSHVLPYAPAMSGQAVFGANTEASMRFYREWQARAEREGIDIGRYFDVVWRFRFTEEETRITSFIREMTVAAREADVPLHLHNLLRDADAHVHEAEAVFDAARAVAREHGLNLRLPALRPRNLRHCPAVDEGGAFIAWDGKVAPCYFLWRDYHCHMYGMQKQVVARFFGTVGPERGQDIIDVWNGAEYRAFRDRVTAKGYPFCANCNVYPCDDIETTTFETDCYGEPVPCGDCPWCLGLLQCMGQEVG